MMQRRMRMRMRDESPGMVRMRQTITSLLQSRKFAFFGALALNMGLIEDESRKTIAADGANIRFNPKWVEEHHAEDLRVTVSRIVLACALKHHTRRGDRNYGKWQRASKMATTPILKDLDIVDAHGGQGMDMGVESIYEILDDEEGDEEQDGDGEGEGGGGSGGFTFVMAPGQGQGQNQPQQDQGQGQGQQQGQGQNQGQGQGGGGGGQGSHDPTGQGEIMDADPAGSKGNAGGNKDKLEKDWDQAMQQALQMSKAQGYEPGSLADMIYNAHNPIADWEEILRMFMQQNAKQDYTWSYPNARHIASGLYLPSLRSEQMPSVVLAIDNSQSMDTESLEKVWSEIKSIAQSVVPEKITIIQCDTDINRWDEYEPYDLPELLNVQRGGGTMYTPLFEAMEMEEEPACLIYFTDLCCSDYPENQPNYPVLWVQAGEITFGEPPFGEIVQVI